IQYRVSDSHRIGTTISANDLMFARYPSLLQKQRIARFIESPIDGQMAPEESKLWVTSVDMVDHWQVLSRVRVDYGARVDYYGYQQDSVACSPRLEASYSLVPSVSVRGAVYRNQTAPGN